MNCPCGQEIPFGALCRTHWALIPGPLKISWSAAQREGGPIAARLTKAVRDYTQFTLSIQSRGKQLTEAGRNQYKRADLNREINEFEARQRELLDKWAAPQNSALRIPQSALPS